MLLPSEGIGAAAGLSAVSLLLALALGAQEREVTLTRLATHDPAFIDLADVVLRLADGLITAG